MLSPGPAVALDRPAWPVWEEHPMILYTILPLTLFSINYNETDKSRLGYEIKYDL